MKKNVFIAILIVVLSGFNLRVVIDDNVKQRICLLNEIEASADNNESPSMFGNQELRTYPCDDGSYYHQCDPTTENISCDTSEESVCGPESNPIEGDFVIEPGKENEMCSMYGHNFEVTSCFKTCMRCSLTIQTCE